MDIVSTNGKHPVGGHLLLCLLHPAYSLGQVQTGIQNFCFTAWVDLLYLGVDKGLILEALKNKGSQLFSDSISVEV